MTTGICDNAFPAGHTGQNLWELTIQMYNYHNDLRASHAASSPWWAWPMDLKPVWFENANYAGDTGTMIYDGGNPALWWMAIFAMGFICWQAFKRRSLGLTLSPWPSSGNGCPGHVSTEPHSSTTSIRHCRSS